MVLFWSCIGFLGLVGMLLALDLGIFHHKDRTLSVPEALAWTGFWIVLALVFNVAIYWMYAENWLGIASAAGVNVSGKQAALQFFTGYVIEKSLSLDNIFIIALIFSYFQIPLQYQHRVLYWGVFGAIVMRGLMIAGGTLLLAKLVWMEYVFGAFLLLTAGRMLVARHDNLDPNKNILVYLVKRILPVHHNDSGNRFLVLQDGRWAITPLFLALLMVESMDVVFAVDSIPAIFSITRDPFLVFTSNIFAILGLRSLYFALAALMGKFRYLRTSLVFLLAFIGVKMLIAGHWPISTTVSLAVVAGILSVGIMASLIAGNRDTAALRSPLENNLAQLFQITYKGARKIVILIVGTTIILMGLVMLVVPGPGILTITIGLAILATEIAWARLLLRRLKKEASTLGNSLVRIFKRKEK